ncbi:MAG: cell division protein ZapE [Bauldia sp.]
MSAPPAGSERLAARYADLVTAGTFSDDPAQRSLAERLDRLNAALAERRLARKGSALGWLFAGKAADVRGLYIFGEVGRGKTMLMDEFFAIAAPQRKRRVHFHEFMADVHDRIEAARQAGKNGNGRQPDPIAVVVAQLAGEIRLLCLDEFAVNDIADAMILSRLFAQLFERGLVLVATSNSAPDDLYPGGLNRGLFLPFIAILKRHVDIVELAARTDYRLEKLGRLPVYVTPLGVPATAALDAVWQRLTGTDHGRPASLPIKGRSIAVPQAEKGVARFAFAELCETPLGPADFLKIARSFHTIIVDNIPVLRDEEQNTVRRLISLVDTLYDNRVKLVASAAAAPDALYRATDGEEAFAFRRTVSRLMEMRSAEWLALAHGQVEGISPAAAIPG